MPPYEHLSARLHGALRTPADGDDYAAGVSPFNTTIVHHPDAVVAAADEHDVVETLRFADEHGVHVGLHTTGHGAYAPYTDGIVLDLSALTGVTVDPAAKTATVGGGSRWRPVVEAAAAHGLAPITGSSPGVGVVGFLLGGGIGPLSRTYGFGSDRVVAARVVTGTGEVLVASADGDAELLWAIRGGKAGLGVITEVTLSLVDIPALYAGSLFFDIEHADAVLPGWLDWTRTAPDTVTTSTMLIRFPDFEQVPPPFRGRHLLSLRFAFPGDETEGAALAAPLRALAPVHLDAIGPLGLADVGRISNDPEQGGPSYGRGWMLADADRGFASALLGLIGAGSQLPIMGAEIRHLGGALAGSSDPAVDGTAVGYRDFGYALTVFGVPDPSLFAEVLPGVFGRLAETLAPWRSPHLSANWIFDPTDPAQLASAWPDATRERLGEVRRRTDPERVLGIGAY